VEVREIIIIILKVFYAFRLRPKPEPRVVDWMEVTDEALLYLSVLTIR
jgi:hypothetical protein